jgi:SAM-dependent methyltransferase
MNQGSRSLAIHRKLPRAQAIYALTIFVSAFLLFQLQPIVGRMVLPWFGGSASVWTICLLFFQSLLLVGYLYAHLSITFLGPRAQRLLHLTLLAASALSLPLALSQAWQPSGLEDPAFRVLWLLILSVGLPYFVLSTTSPLVQAWYAAEFSHAIPYRLFALSNLASMLALLSYPLLLEPALSLREQSVMWSSGYLIFLVCCAALAWRVNGSHAAVARPTEPASVSVPVRGLLLLWVFLSFCPSMLLIAITTHLTQNVAPIPFLWILPLAVYLLSFILCFESARWYRRALFLPLMVLALGAMAYAVLDDESTLGVLILVPLFATGLFIVAMTCHGEVARLRPDARYLTHFYLMISVGGMLGGLFVGLIAPRVFNAYYDLPLGMILTSLAVLAALRYDRSSLLYRGRKGINPAVAVALFVGLTAALSRQMFLEAHDARIMVRNFYGVLKIKESASPAMRTLYHGRIVHGTELLTEGWRRRPTTYYSETSGVGIAILATQGSTAQHVGVVGLGAGTLAAYGRRGDSYRFYEINPLVIDIARSEFFYLTNCQAQVEVVLGDARLSLEREHPQAFDVLAVDAFSGDSIPVHLLTTQAFSIYRRHMKPDGILAIHVSNRYLDLAAVVKQAADNLDMVAKIIDTEDDEEEITYGAKWVLLSSSATVLEGAAFRSAQPATASRPVRLWTDDYTSIYPLLQ